jgi:hypothetical protein
MIDDPAKPFSVKSRAPVEKESSDTLGLEALGHPFDEIQIEIAEAVRGYWDIAAEVLAKSGVRLLALPPDLLSLRRNFFSALFLYSYHRAGIEKPRRIFYATVNHCLRGMVTGCDNLLDEEYKQTLATDLPENARRFRSVLDIMVSDRVLFSLLLKAKDRGELLPEQVLEASFATLRALARSGVQEAGEEGGVENILEPAEVLEQVHHFKTGLLFQCPWALPLLVEKPNERVHAPILAGLFKIGIGCQIMDDLVDMGDDIGKKRHNYLVSLVEYGADAAEREKLHIAMRDGSGGTVLDFPHALRAASAAARSHLQAGLDGLFSDALKPLTGLVIEWLASLIGADRLMSRGEDTL